MAQEMSKATVVEEEYRVPPYFDRYQEEREKWVQSKLHRVEEGVRRNGERIGELSEDMGRRFDQQGAWIKFTFGILSTGMVAILVKLFVK